MTRFAAQISVIIVLCIFLLYSSFSSLPESTAFENVNGSFEHRPNQARTAYVFYATNLDYVCYALVNIGRLLQLGAAKHMDIVIIVLPHLNDRKLHTMYDRVLYLDSDGLILQNTDHLFTLPLNANTSIAMSYCHNLVHKWLCSCMFVAELSAALNQAVQQLVSTKGLHTLNAWVSEHELARVSGNSDANDMELLNYLLDRGNGATILNVSYLRWDTHFHDNRHAADLQHTFYVHFEYRTKPLLHPQALKWALNTTPPTVHPATYISAPFSLIHSMFWQAHAQYCPVQHRRFLKLYT